MRLRQVALVAAELAPTRNMLFQLLGITDDFADPGVAEFGLVNSVMSIGDTYLEIVAPKEAGTAAGRLLERRGATCGYMALLQVEDYADFDAHLQALQVRKVWEVERAEVSACHVHPKDIGAAIVSFDQMRPPESWLWAGPDWRENCARNAQRIVGCEVRSPDPAALAERWGQLMRVTPVLRGDALRLEFADASFVDFVAGSEYAGINAVTFVTDARDSIYARAAELGLCAAGAAGPIVIGELELRFLPG